jgi:hypothetical protein
MLKVAVEEGRQIAYQELQAHLSTLAGYQQLAAQEPDTVARIQERISGSDANAQGHRNILNALVRSAAFLSLDPAGQRRHLAHFGMPDVIRLPQATLQTPSPGPAIPAATVDPAHAFVSGPADANGQLVRLPAHATQVTLSDGDQIPVFLPVEKRNSVDAAGNSFIAPDSEYFTAESLQAVLRRLHPVVQDVIDGTVSTFGFDVEPGEHPWFYAMDGFTRVPATTEGERDTLSVSLFPYTPDTSLGPTVTESYITHELGHALSMKYWGDMKDPTGAFEGLNAGWQGWVDAQKADGRGVSRYGSGALNFEAPSPFSPREDFAETFVLFVSSLVSPEAHAGARAKYRHRFALVDQLLAKEQVALPGWAKPR